MTKGYIEARKFEHYSFVTTITNWFMCVHYTCTIGPFKRRNYTRLSNSERMVLQKSFTENAYPKKATIRMFSQQLRLSESRVSAWFEYQRRRVNARFRKYNETSFTGKHFSIAIHAHICIVLDLSVSISLVATAKSWSKYTRNFTKYITGSFEC